jgi:Fe2+ or Zn2+ uptake regulation protein
MRNTNLPPTLSAARDAELRQALVQAGWRCTRQRTAVFAFLCAADFHPTAEQAYDAVRRRLPNISLATVYKALDALVDAGLAARFAAGDGPARYDPHPEAHYHLRCLKSGRIQDLPLPYDPALPARVAPGLVEELGRQGFQVTGHRFELLGHFQDE